MKAFPVVGCVLALIGFASSLRAQNKVVVHEWGTFTCLQDENGNVIGGINVDDEPAPRFVHFAGGIPVISTTSFGAFGLPPYGALQEEGSSLAFGAPSVTLRLETPVLYIYPPAGRTPESVPPLKVHVDFHGGILGQYYPYARFKGAPLGRTGLTAATTTSLDWTVRSLGMTEQPVATTDKVWTTPREVSAPTLTVDAPKSVSANGTEVEKFLFYRGLGHLDSSIVASTMRAMADTEKGLPNEHTFVCVSCPKSGLKDYKATWLVDIRNDGSSAFQFLSPQHEAEAQAPAGFHPLVGFNLTPDMTFGAQAYSPANLAQLKASMHAALVKEGLYDDEASAMLKTWELSYFKSPGLRFFYLVPRPWVDQVLPLKITGAPTEVTRVMMGRIELIDEPQRAALARLAAGPSPNLASIRAAAFDALQKSKLTDAEEQAFFRGEKPLADLGVAIPPPLQDYLSLGRFRDALVVHKQQQRPKASLAQFIRDNDLATP